MSFYLEEECPVTFDFDYAKLAEDVISFCIEHEGFPYEAEVNLTLTDNEGIHAILSSRWTRSESRLRNLDTVKSGNLLS